MFVLMNPPPPVFLDGGFTKQKPEKYNYCTFQKIKKELYTKREFLKSFYKNIVLANHIFWIQQLYIYVCVCVCYRPRGLGVCPNYEVVEFQPQTVTPLELGSINND